MNQSESNFQNQNINPVNEENNVFVSSGDISHCVNSETSGNFQDSSSSSVEVEREPVLKVEDRNWYIVQCYSNQEMKVQARIESLIQDSHLTDKIFQVLIPREETVEIKNNKRMEKTVKIFPGYIFIEMIPDEEVYFQIRRLPGVSKFIGSKFSPLPVTQDDILRVLRKSGDKSKKIEVDFLIGDFVKVVSGPFRGYSGPISEINIERGKLKAKISIFSRETPVELDFDQVEKMVQ